jgi:2-hydroxy-3-oxopropionate reductase
MMTGGTVNHSGPTLHFNDVKIRVTLLGTGLMGAPMARNLARQFPVTVWNRTPDKALALTDSGVRVAESLDDAVADADAVITMLADGPTVASVLADITPHLRPGTLVIDMSSIAPSQARHQATRLAARGLRPLDAPVSGGTTGAAAATLAIMVGGTAADYQAARPIFEALGRTTLVGPAGAGQMAKLANQVIVGITIGAVAEALLLAQTGGADGRAVRGALMGGFADSRILDLHGNHMLDRDFTPGGRAVTQLKDLDNALAEAKALGLRLPILETVAGLYRDMVAAGNGDLDHAGLLVELERINGIG